MINLKKNILVVLFCVLIAQVYAQSSLSHKAPITIKHSVIDTVEVSDITRLINMLWLNDTIQVRIKYKDIEIDTTDVSILASTESIKKFHETSTQNCYSYAIEKYFENNNTFNQHLFNGSTNLMIDSAEKILANYFTELERFTTNPKRNLNHKIPDDVLLTFKDEYGTAIHFVYYDNGVFYTKNGAIKQTTFTSLKKFLKRWYIHTYEIVIYKIDENKVKGVLEQ